MFTIGDVVEYNRTHDSKGRLIPTVPQPTMDELEDIVFDSVCPATDGCEVEPDGHCYHGHPSWLLYLGLI